MTGASELKTVYRDLFPVRVREGIDRSKTVTCRSMYSFSASAIHIILALLQVTSFFEVQRMEEINIYFTFIVISV